MKLGHATGSGGTYLHGMMVMSSDDERLGLLMGSVGMHACYGIGTSVPFYGFCLEVRNMVIL